MFATAFTGEKFSAANRPDFIMPAVNALDSVRKSCANQILASGFFGRKPLKEIHRAGLLLYVLAVHIISIAQLIVCVKYIIPIIFGMISSVIKVKLKELLEKKKKSIYQLQQETGVSYPTLHKIANGKPESISFKVLEKICDNLECELTDLLAIEK